MSKPIFISHANANYDSADSLVDLLESGIGIPDNDIFCSSLEGLGVPSGTNFVEFIRNQVSQPRVVILLLTEDYFNSQFCLSELGASWVLSHKMIPILVPPLEYKDVKAVLTGIQVLKITDASDLNQMQEELINTLSIKGKPFVRWEIKRDKFLDNVNEILSKMTQRKSVSLDEYNKLQSRYEEAREEISKLSDDLTKKETLIEELIEAKDEEDVRGIMKKTLDEPEVFNRLVEKANEVLDNLPDMVKEALFYYFRNEVLPWPNPFDNYRVEQINKVVEEDYLKPYDEGCYIIEDDPKIENALKVLSELEDFVNSIEETAPFYDYYTENYDHRLNFKSRRFWETHLL